MKTTLYLLGVIRRRLILTLVLFVLFALGGVGAAYIKKPTFESSAKLLLNTDSLPLSLSRAELPQIGGGSPTVETISTLIEILTARELMVQLVDDLGEAAFKSPPPSNPVIRAVVEWIDSVSTGLSNNLARFGLIEQISPKDGLIQALQARLTVYPVRQSQVVEVVMTWPTPKVPQMVTARLMELFLARVESLNTLTSEKDLFADQADQTARELAAAQSELRELQQAYDVVNPTQEIQRLNERIALNEQALAVPETKTGVGQESGAIEGSRIDDLLRRISALEIDLAGAQALYARDSAAVREVTARLAAAKAANERETSQIASSLASDRPRLEALLQVEDRFVAIGRTIEAKSDALRSYRQAAADRALMTLQSERVHVRMIDAPAYPLKSTGPSRLVLVIVAILGALLLAVAVSLLINRWSDDLEKSRAKPSDQSVKDDAQDVVTARPIQSVGGTIG